MICPGCRSKLLRRRKRRTLGMFLDSLRGRWPYRCGDCGKEFVLEERAPSRTRKLADRDLSESERLKDRRD